MRPWGKGLPPNTEFSLGITRFSLSLLNIGNVRVTANR